MKKCVNKILTIFFGITLSLEIFAAVVTQENAQTHLRYKIAVQKDLIVISKKSDEVTIKSLNPETFKTISDELIALKGSDDYIKGIEILPKGEGSSVSILRIKLVNPEVELFTFYKEREKYYVMDFWTDAETILGKDKKLAETPIQKVNDAPKAKELPVAKTPGKGGVPSLLKRPAAEKKAKKIRTVQAAVKKNPKFRDFRYGSSFIWDYKSLAPGLKEIVNLSRKTPEFFYPIKDRQYNKK